MTDKIPTIEKRILDELKAIADINEILVSCKRRNSQLMVRQYEHLKKEHTKNLFKMLQESYQIKIPVTQKEAA
ncbi:MAG: hypothetical protein AAF960_22385 [Bacteroidota bacterium]